MPNTITDGRQLWRGDMVPLSRRGKVVGATDERGRVSATGAGTAATADGHGGKGKVHFLVTICNNFAIPTSCGPKIFMRQI